MKGKKWIALLLALVMSVSLFACGAQPETNNGDSQNTGDEAATRVFTDSCGREVTVPVNVEKVAVSGPLAQIVVFAMAPDKLVGIANAWNESAAQFLDTKYYDLPLLGQLYGGKGEMNLETLLAAAPDVVIDVGEPKGSIVEDMDALQEQTGIPFVHIDAYLASMDNTYAMLGDLLAMPNEAQGRADYCRYAYDRAVEIANSVEKANLLYITGDEGLNVIAKGSYHAEAIDLLANNLAVVEEPSSKGTGNEVDMEQILNWNPDVILFAPGSIYASVGSNENWQTVTAIKNGDEVLGNQVRVKVVKNKVAPPFRKAEFEITFGEGISRVSELMDLAVANDILQKSGSWFSYEGDKIAQGREQLKRTLKDNPDLMAEIEQKVMAAVQDQLTVTEADTSSEFNEEEGEITD